MPSFPLSYFSALEVVLTPWRHHRLAREALKKLYMTRTPPRDDSTNAVKTKTSKDHVEALARWWDKALRGILTRSSEMGDRRSCEGGACRG
ncbi:hypothetical protein Trydic_g18931 [Trypoxylus dichotomus]